MFKLTFKYRLERLQKAKDLYPKARQKFRDRIASIAIPKIKQDVANLMAPYPGPSINGNNSDTPWQFATDLSRKWFFANFPNGYDRTFELEKGWQVYLITTFEGNASFLSQLVRGTPLVGDISVIIANDTMDNISRGVGPNVPYSFYVYGPRQVQGHARTGWSLQVNQNRAVVQKNAMGYISAEWGPSVKAALVEG